MYKTVYKAIERILNNPTLSEPILNIHLPRRAKFERYLQSVLANELKHLYSDTTIERSYSQKDQFVDIYSNNTFIELKTPNTNFKVTGIPSSSGKAITDSIDDIRDDIRKLKQEKLSTDVNGVVAFVIFPIKNTDQIQRHLKKIKLDLNSSKIMESAVGLFYIFSAEV